MYNKSIGMILSCDISYIRVRRTCTMYVWRSCNCNIKFGRSCSNLIHIFEECILFSTECLTLKKELRLTIISYNVDSLYIFAQLLHLLQYDKPHWALTKINLKRFLIYLHLIIFVLFRCASISTFSHISPWLFSSPQIIQTFFTF